jgi:hypothetical protein
MTSLHRLQKVSKRTHTAVQSLDLTYWHIRGPHGGEIIRSLLINNRRITKLNLWGNRQLGSEGAASIAQALRDDHFVLKELILYGCIIGNEGTRQLCGALHLTTTFW